MQKITDMMTKIFGNEFSLQDMCAKGYLLEFGPYKAVIFEKSIFFSLGPVPMEFSKCCVMFYFLIS